MSSSQPLAFSLQDIQAAQTSKHIVSFGEDHAQAHANRLQHLHAALLAQREAFMYCMEQRCTLVICSPTQKLRLNLGEGIKELYPPIIDILDEELRALEAQIVLAHLALEKSTAEPAGPEPTLAASIRALCTPAPAAA